MLEGLAAWVLNTYVGEYVENLNTDQLSIALLQGAVELENLPLKKDALKSFGLPLQVKSGFIGKITLHIPLRRLHSEPWVISIERLYLVAGPLIDTEYDEERESAAEAAHKAKMLEALEAKMQVQKSEKQDSSWFSYGTSVLANILENLQLNIKDVHIRYEDDTTNLNCPFSFGVVIKNLSAQSTDGNWVPKFVSRDNVEMMHKLVDLQNFSLYFDTNTTLVGDLTKYEMSDYLQREMYISSITSQFKEHEYILSPVSASAKMKRYTTPLPMRSADIPRNTIDLNLKNMAFALSEDQYRNIVMLLREFEKHEKSKRYRKWRPTCPVKNNAKEWWQFAIQSKLHHIKDRNKRLTMSYITNRVTDVSIYIKIYSAQLKGEVLDPAMKVEQTRIEEDWSFDEIKLMRELIYRKFRRSGVLSKASSVDSDQSIKKSPSSTQQEDKTLLQRWFPGWGGWYGSQSSSQESELDISDDSTGEPPTKVSRVELEQELQDEVEFVLGDGDDDKSVLKKDAVFAKLNFCLNTGSFKVMGNKLMEETGDIQTYSIMELECNSIEMMFESRPRTHGISFDLSVGGLQLFDKMTENSLFPCLVGSQNKERFGPKRQTGTSGFQKATITPVQEETNVKLFELMYEKNPFQTSANYRFSIVTQPLDIIYNKTAFRRVRDVFSSKNIYVSKKTESSISAAARRQYETIKRQTKAELKHSLTQLFEGSEKVKRWHIKLDVAAPQIIIPENFQSENTGIVVLDLGHLKFHNTPNGQTDQDNGGNNEDEFLTPMSTPPNEKSESNQSSFDIEQLSKLELNESDINNKIYDRYTLELTDLQVMSGKMKDNWKHIYHRNTTPLHLVDRFSISLQLERRLLYTTDPNYPTIIVSGNLPSLTVHVNEQKIQNINACIKTLSSQSSQSSGQNINQSGSSLSLTESSSGINLEELREITQDNITLDKDVDAEEKLKELLEESLLLLTNFSVNQMSFEIHSRDRAVAELQISGVKVSMTKRPYDTNVKLTVHSLLVVDALQTYGQDFELLVASHRNIVMDSTSGSIRDSAATSPTMMSPRSPPGSPIEHYPSVSSSSGIQGAVQDVMSRAFQVLTNIGETTPSVSKETDVSSRQLTSPLPLDDEALIIIDFEMINSNSPSNKSGEGSLNVANLQFNNLDIIANMETVVEIVSFLKRTVPQTSPSEKKRSTTTKTATSVSNESTINQSMFNLSKQEQMETRTEVTAEFNRLSILMMRLESSSGKKSARKVATATMSCARLQASIDSDLSMNGSLGGFHVYDITPEHKRHRQLFSVGQDICPGSKSILSSKDMYKTADESMLNQETIDDNKAFIFSFTKPLRMTSQCGFTSELDVNSKEDNSDCIKMNLRVASLCYTHSPTTVYELSLCVAEFKEYKVSVASSIKNVASEVAKGMVAKRNELSQMSMYGSSNSLEGFGGSKLKLNQTYDKTESEYFDNSKTFLEEDDVKKNRIMLDACFESPVIVVPKHSTSSNVLVAHLGKISVNNTDDKSHGCSFEEVLADDNDDEKLDRIFVEVRNMNLYSVNIDFTGHSGLDKSMMNLDGSLDYRSLTVDSNARTPIMYDTTVQITIDHSGGNSQYINANTDGEFLEQFHPKDVSDSFSVMDNQPMLDMRAKIQTPLKLLLLKSVYEQILQTSDYLSSAETMFDQTETNTNQNAASSDSLNDLTGSQSNQGQSESMQSSGRFSSLNQSTVDKPFLTKKLRLEVPLFSVELRGDFGEGERGVVELKLHRFLLDMTKDNPATTKIELSLKSLVMDDLLEDPDSKHRQIMVSKEPKKEDYSKPREFLSQSCPDNAIIAPIPMMPHSLPSSFSNLSSKVNQPVTTRPLSGFGAFIPTPSYTRGRSHPGISPNTPPPSPLMTRSLSHDEILEENLVHISVILVDKSSPEYKDKYNETKRFVDVDFNCLDTKINQQTWVVLLDFLGLGAKVPDIDELAGKETKEKGKPIDPEVYEQPVVNSEINIKVENLSIILNKPEYQFAEASVSKMSAHLSLRDGNFDVKGQLGKMCVLDLSPSGSLYRERFLTVGDQAFEFDFFKYGLPDPWLKRDYDMKLKLRMSSVRYTHTNKFQAEMLGFVQQFLQLQDVLGRMRAASAGKKINEEAFHNPRILFDIEAGSPIILIPHSSKTTDVLVADLGRLSVRNCFKFDGDTGTFNGNRISERDKTPTDDQSGLGGSLSKESVSRTNSTTSVRSSSSRTGIITSRSVSQTDGSQSGGVHLVLSQTSLDEMLSPGRSDDPMTSSIYGNLDLDVRNESSMLDTSDVGSSVDPGTPSDRRHLSPLSSPGSDVFTSKTSPLSDVTITDQQISFIRNKHDGIAMVTDTHKCLLDVLDVRLCDMDLFSAERIEKKHYKGKSIHQDLEFPSCVIQRQGCKLLKEKCMLYLQIERNLEGDQSHNVPDIRVQGSLSSVHCCLDITQYKLIRGLLDHNLGEKFENFKKELMTHMQNPNIQTVLSGDVWTVISMAVDLNNVTLELLTSHHIDPQHPEVSLAKLDFIRSRLSYDLFSDQSKETDLVSKEILASDTRFRDVAINQRRSVFERILQPTKFASSDSLQLELHYRATLDGAGFKVILNNMKLLCSFEWLIAVQEFIGTKPDNPFLTDESMVEGMREEVQSPTLSSSSRGSRTASPLSTSGGIITKRGAPPMEQSDVPFELKLNVTDTEFVVVENLVSSDSNAVILKCTSVLSYRPKAQDKMLSCNLQSLEVFSCSLQAEEETALSIVDPMSITIELNVNPLPILKQNVSAGLVDAMEFDQKQMLLEVSCNTMNVRLSYQDMKLFLAIMDSLPKQTTNVRQSTQSPVSELLVNQLMDMNFSREDCIKSLKINKDDMEEAAVWLTQNAKVVKPDGNKLTAIDVNMTTFCLCLIDDCQDADIPLVELNFYGMNLKYEPGKEGKAGFQITGDYYNRTLAGWEPLIEQWRCHAQWKNFKQPEKKLAIEISAPDVLNINVTSTLLELYNLTKDKWTEDYYKQKDGTQKELGSPGPGAKRRQLLTPYAVRNNTGSVVWFAPITVDPSNVGIDTVKYSEQNLKDLDMKCVPPNEELEFDFHRKAKLRHKKSDSLRVNQLVVKVEGWQRLSPVSVDKVGTYFRNTFPDVSKPSIIKVNDQQEARVVFDIKQEGSARKVITLRSGLIVTNKLDGPVDLRMDSPIIPGRYDHVNINPGQQKSIPMTFVLSKLWARPSDWPVEFCDASISWQNVQKPREVYETFRQCKVMGTDDIYRYCVAVQRELYPEERTQTGLNPLPGHTVILLPPVTIVNLLPAELSFYFKGTGINGGIKPGKQSQLHSVDLSKDLELGLKLENFEIRRELVITPGTRSYTVRIKMLDSQKRPLELYVRILARSGGSLKIIINAPFWLVNRCGLPLVFKQDGAQQEAAGQFEENEMARIVSPLLFSFSERECPYLCEMRIGKHKHGPRATPQWSNSFSLEKEANVCQLHVVPKDGNRPDWVYIIGIQIAPGKGQFRHTSIVTFSPRYQIDNMSEHKVAIAQRHFTNKEAIHSPDGHLTALPSCKMPFHWPRQDLDQLLCVKLLDVDDCNWSGGFKIDAVSSFHVNMRDGRKNSLLLKVEILLQDQTFNIIFSDAEEMPPPFRIDNMSEVSLRYYQTKTQDERLRAIIRPQTSLPYAWDEPTLDPYLTLSVANGTTATYNLDNLGEGEQLTYQNYLYICATTTLTRGNSYSEGAHNDLVLDCEHNYVIFRKREAGKRSQLWRMTSSGMLEHEGTGQPLDPRKSGSERSGQRFVLDIADIALQPGKPVALALKKADDRRAAKQTWRFQNGMLCCTTGNFCVQAVSNTEGCLQDGSLAVLGPGPDEGVEVPACMRISHQKLHPGSGCLTVRIQMDGPVRVLQINDVQQRNLKRKETIEDEDWEIYEESLNHKTNEKRKKIPHKNIELDVNLKGGLGISVVNKVPEELLYIALKNITLNYRSHHRGTTLEMSVANIQVDNQMFGGSPAVMLFVTPTPKRDVVENTHALLISAHKLPNVGWNAEIFKHVIISMKRLTIQLEEQLLWKLVQFAGIGQSDTNIEKIEEGIDDLQKTLSITSSVKTKRYYFGTLRLSGTCITLSMVKASSLPQDLATLKQTMGFPLINFEADVDLERFNKCHQFESKEFFMHELKKHYKDELKGQAMKILGSVDFLGNPLGLVNDVAEGFVGLIEDGNIGGLAKGIFHGFSNSTAKMTGALSEGLSTVHNDSKHNMKRQQIRSSATSSSSQFMSGLRGLGHGIYGGVKSIVKPFEGAVHGGIEGFGVGLYQGVTGIVTKPVAGVLDFASGMSNAVRDASRRSCHMQPEHIRKSRCCYGPGGLLPSYTYQQAESQALLHKLNDHCYEEIFIAVETVRGGSDMLFVMITNQQVFFLRNLDPELHKENIILNVKHRDYTLCRNIEIEGRFYVEILRSDDRSSIRYHSNKKPQVRCDKRSTALKVAQKINYAKNLFDEQKFCVPALPFECDDKFI
ncbi:Vacuolar protein sorting-associated protein 13D [Mactra antiquata]